MPKKRTSKKEAWKAAVILAAAAVIFVGSTFFIWLATFKVPDISEFEQRKIAESTKIYDRTGTILLYDLYKDIKRTVLPFSEISRNIKNATVAIEDGEFWQHHGIKPKSILRAVFVNLGSGNFTQGGSTITQQVVKNSLLTSEKKISRKLKEWVLALKLEKILSKEEILALYLNETPYGGSLYGVEEASMAFFGKRAKDLDIAESAYLAAIPQAPTYYSPYGNNRDKLEARKNVVLQRMLSQKFITEKEYEEAVLKKVDWKPQENYGIKAPHFVIFIKQLLEEKYGEKALSELGLKVITTLDYDLQKKAEGTAKEYALRNKENFNAENAAIVAIDPKTGNILTMVGSRDYFDKKIDGNFNVTLAKRQPGSAFKPFAYAAAFLKGYTDKTALFDLQTEFSTECNPDGTPIIEGNEDKCYHPKNYDEVFRGPMTMRTALAQSINVPSVKTLYLAGAKETLRLAKDMGIQSLGNSGEYGLTLVLGGGEVSLLELTSAYSVFANGGERNPWNAILRIEDKDGNELESFVKNPTPALSEDTALLISDILSDNEARGPSFGGRESPLYFSDIKVAAKTGTTNDYKDAWVVGYTPTLTVGAWAGNNNNAPMEKKVAGFIVAPMWRAFMNEALKTVPKESFKEPSEENGTVLPAVLKGFWQGGKIYLIDKISGKKATSFTPDDLKEEKVVREVHSILYWIDKNNPRGEKPADPMRDQQFERWEYPVRKWALENGLADQTDAVIPKDEDPIHRPEFFPKVSVVNPKNSGSYDGEAKILVQINASGKFSINKADFFLNGVYAGSTSKAPWSFVFAPEEFALADGQNELKVVVYDYVKNRGEASVLFSVSNRGR